MGITERGSGGNEGGGWGGRTALKRLADAPIYAFMRVNTICYNYRLTSDDTKSYYQLTITISKDYCQECDLKIWIQLKILIGPANCAITSVR